MALSEPTKAFPKQSPETAMLSVHPSCAPTHLPPYSTLSAEAEPISKGPFPDVAGYTGHEHFHLVTSIPANVHVTFDPRGRTPLLEPEPAMNKLAK